MTVETGAREEPRQRLHPLTPLLRSFNMLAIAIAAISWQGYGQLGFRRWLIALAIAAVAVAAYSVVAWFMTGYQVVGRELRVHQGVIWRRTRAIPLERLQAAELVQPVIPRLFGLAELRLEVVGGSKAEAPLAYLPADDAAALRDHLLALARGVGAAVRTAPEAAGVQPPDEFVIHAVANRDLIMSQLLRPQVWFVPLAVGGIMVSFLFDGETSLIGLAGLLTAIMGAIIAPVRQVLNEWRFTIGTSVDGLRLRRGLLERRHQTVPPGRVQAVGVQWPLLWRSRGWVRARIDVAGVGTPGEQNTREGTLLPVGTVPTARTVIGHVLPDFDLTSVTLLPVPPAARWLAPLRHRVLGYRLTDTSFVVRYGLVTRELVVVPYARIQSVRVTQGPIQRRLKLATIYADTAGGSLRAVAEHRAAAEAKALAEELADRSRAARNAPIPSLPRPTDDAPAATAAEAVPPETALPHEPAPETAPGAVPPAPPPTAPGAVPPEPAVVEVSPAPPGAVPPAPPGAVPPAPAAEMPHEPAPGEVPSVTAPGAAPPSAPLADQGKVVPETRTTNDS